MRIAERIKILSSDYFKFNGLIRRAASSAIEYWKCYSKPTTPDEIAYSLEHLARAGRGGFGLRDLGRLESQIRQLMQQWSPTSFQWGRFFPKTQSASIGKSIILKKPQSAREKGVLFVAFEAHWIRLFRHADIKALAHDYDLVLSPTWSPPHDLALFIAARLWPTQLFTILSNFDDMSVFQRLSPKIRPIPLLASSWVNPDVVWFGCEPEKKFDIVMLANFSRYKRHFALFQAMSNMDNPVKVLLLGVAWEGRSRETLLREAELFGVQDQIVIKEALPDNEMFQELRSAKVSVIMSMLEGSCVAVVESLFAGVPVGLLEGARIGSSAFINKETGRFLRPDSLASDLTDFLNHYNEYRPRMWAMENGISCRQSSILLNEYLRSASLESGQAWTVDLSPMHWRPYGKYVFPNDKQPMREEYERFKSAYGVSIDL